MSTDSLKKGPERRDTIARMDCTRADARTVLASTFWKSPRVYTADHSSAGMHVLVPVDGSAQSEEALDYVLENFPGPRITLLHVLDPIHLSAYGFEDGFDSREFERAIDGRREQAEEMLDEYRDHAARHGVEIETTLTTGRPARRILEAVERDDVDHVVMGSRGRSGVGRVLFGSVAESVTRRAAVPVTIVR